MKKRILALLLAAITVFHVFPVSALPTSAEQSESTSNTDNGQQNSVSETETAEGYILGKLKLSGDNITTGGLMVGSHEKAAVYVECEEEFEGYTSYQWQMKTSTGWAEIVGYIHSYATISRALFYGANSDSTSYIRCIVTNGNNSYSTEELKVTILEEDKYSHSEISTSTEVNSPLYLEGDTEEPEAESYPPSTLQEGAWTIVINYVYRHDNPASILGDFDGTTAANTFAVSLAPGGSYSGSIISPAEVGYLPYVEEQYKSYVTPGTSPDTVKEYGTGDKRKRYVPANSIEFSRVSEATTITVYYIPQDVTYTVNYYEQKLYDDDYALAESKTEIGTANAVVAPDLYSSREGFLNIVKYDDTAPINEDGTTVVEIYYERIYYNVNFEENKPDMEVNSNVIGLVSRMVRFNTPIVLPRPSLKGYDFSEWTLKSVTDKDGTPVQSHSYSSSVSAGVPVNIRHNLVYRANWSPTSTIYTVVYWIENTNSTDNQVKSNYDVWYTHKVNATTGQSSIAGGNHITTYVTTKNGFTQDEVSDVSSTLPYLTYQSSLTDTSSKTIIGDGRTTINVYYSRNEYTLKFYYAIEKVTNNSPSYYIIGGSSWYFGSMASGTAQNDEKAAMRQYATGSCTGQTGQVTALPSLNDKGRSRNYTLSADEDGSNKYHYLSFSAKFGADISNLWPCDVFNSATRSSRNTHGQWSGNQAFVSAWNGEYRVKYTLDEKVNNYNQTIKGNYTVLDQNLLWNDNTITEDVVTYACFWENGANINWSVPELYRYNIYLPLLPEQSTEGLTIKEYNGTTYYLADSYDTCDDSTPAAQTQPGLVGFKSNGRDHEPITSYNTSLYKEAHDMYFFYSRNIYHLTFNDMHGNIVTLSVPYGTFIGNHSEEDHAPAYPSDFEEGEAKFDGWHMDETCTIDFDHKMNMPAKNIQLYAAWKTLSYEVSVYYNLDKNDPSKTKLAYRNDSVLFESLIREPSYSNWVGTPDGSAYASLIFAGWYYDVDSEPVRFDFNTMPIKSDMEIYAKWTDDDLVDYTIYYVAVIDGQYQELAPAETMQAVAGSTKYFIAKTGTDLGEYNGKYFPEMRSHTMTIKANEENVYYFVYTYATEIRYTVTHVFKNDLFKSIIGTDTFTETFEHVLTGEDLLHTAYSVKVSFRQGITADALATAAGIKNNETVKKENLWKAVVAMTPNMYEQNMPLTVDKEKNKIEFEWTYDSTTGTYQVIHYYENLDGEYVTDPNGTQYETVNINTSISVEPSLSNGYTANAVLTKENSSPGVTLSTDADGKLIAAAGTVTPLTAENGKINEGLVIRYYYTLNRYTYTIKHCTEDGSTVFATETPTVEVPHGTKIKIADVYRSDIEGYIVSNETSSVTVTRNGTEVICTYKGLKVNYRYQIIGSAGGSLTVTVDDQNRVGTRAKETTLTVYDGFFLNKWYYVVGNGEKVIIPEDSDWFVYEGDEMTIQPEESRVEWAGETITVYAEVLPTTRRFRLEGDVATSKDQAFIFNLKSTGANEAANVDAMFVIFGNDYVDIARLPYGEYTITIMHWAWRYGDPTIIFDSTEYDVDDMIGDGVYRLNLDVAGDVVLSYTASPETKWLTDDIAGYLTLTEQPKR